MPRFRVPGEDDSLGRVLRHCLLEDARVRFAGVEVDYERGHLTVQVDTHDAAVSPAACIVDAAAAAQTIVAAMQEALGRGDAAA